jgi:hypothetical protein
MRLRIRNQESGIRNQESGVWQEYTCFIEKSRSDLPGDLVIMRIWRQMTGTASIENRLADRSIGIGTLTLMSNRRRTVCVAHRQPGVWYPPWMVA